MFPAPSRYISPETRPCCSGTIGNLRLLVQRNFSIRVLRRPVEPTTRGVQCHPGFGVSPRHHMTLAVSTVRTIRSRSSASR
jgi:hypothetical protein